MSVLFKLNTGLLHSNWYMCVLLILFAVSLTSQPTFCLVTQTDLCGELLSGPKVTQSTSPQCRLNKEQPFAYGFPDAVHSDPSFFFFSFQPCPVFHWLCIMASQDKWGPEDIYRPLLSTSCLVSAVWNPTGSQCGCAVASIVPHHMKPQEHKGKWRGKSSAVERLTAK